MQQKLASLAQLLCPIVVTAPAIMWVSHDQVSAMLTGALAEFEASGAVLSQAAAALQSRALVYGLT